MWYVDKSEQLIIVEKKIITDGKEITDFNQIKLSDLVEGKEIFKQSEISSITQKIELKTLLSERLVRPYFKLDDGWTAAPVYMSDIYILAQQDEIVVLGKNYVMNGRKHNFQQYQFKDLKIIAEKTQGYSGPYQEEKKPDFLTLDELHIFDELRLFRPNLTKSIYRVIDILGIDVKDVKDSK